MKRLIFRSNVDIRQSCVSRFSVFFKRDVDMDVLYAGSSTWLAGKEGIPSLLVMKIRRTSLLVMRYRSRIGAYRLVYDAPTNLLSRYQSKLFAFLSTWRPVPAQFYVVSGTGE